MLSPTAERMIPEQVVDEPFRRYLEALFESYESLDTVPRSWSTC
jgi:hypothetical protein